MRRGEERGLALLLVVSLMALVTLLVVSLAMITRIETQVGATRSQQAVARENALLALEVALGRLQELAGPDQRVTATAEATGAVIHPHWVGVWRTDTTGPQPLAWLVSGEGADPAGETGGGPGMVELVRADGADGSRVFVPLAMLTEATDTELVRGAYGYFIADQGGKAQLRPAASVPGEDEVMAQRRMLSSGARPVGFGDDAEFEGTAEAFQSGLAQAVRSEQWRWWGGEASEVAIARRWHDYTAWSRGLLVDAAAGTLQRDLSVEGDAAIPGLATWQEWATGINDGMLSPTYPIRAGGVSSAGIYGGIHPLVTQIGIQFSVHTIGPTSRTLETRLRFFVELNNPHSSALAPETLTLLVSGLPGRIDIESRTAGEVLDHGVAAVDLTALYARHTDDGGRPAMEFDLPFGASRWEPGRTIAWRLPSGDTMGEAANRELVFDASTRTSYWRERPGEGLDGPDALINDSELRFTGSEDWDVRFTLRGAGGEVLQRGALPVFYAVETAWLDANSTLPDFGVEARLLDRSDFQDTQTRSGWLRGGVAGDLRRQELAEAWWMPGRDLESASYNVAFSGPNSGEQARQLFNRDPVERDYLSYHQPGYNSDVALFELPRQPWQSVGELQHLPFADGPIYNVGNSWSEQNDWFDAFTFSGGGPDGGLSADEAPDSWEPIGAGGETDPTRRAQAWWVRGAFNVNSVRPAAWRAWLRGLGPGGEAAMGLTYTTHDEASGEVTGAATVGMTRPIARFPQSAGEMWERTPNPDNYQAILRTYRGGVRELTDTQVVGLGDILAEGIAERIAAVGPYRSLAEFLAPDEVRFGGGNVIEHAIASFDEQAAAADRINWDHYFPNDRVPIDGAAPGYLTSGDLMTALAPQLAVRSDTFLIRAYGESTAPVALADYTTADREGRAWVEALVQRYPEGVDARDFVQADADDWRQSVADPQWGRRFRVVALRWLTEDDL